MSMEYGRDVEPPEKVEVPCRRCGGSGGGRGRYVCPTCGGRGYVLEDELVEEPDDYEDDG